MSIQMVSISHKTAPLKVRELFAFGADEQILILEILNKHPLILESVMIATCNRTEIYVYSEENMKYLRQSIAQIENGNGKVHELRENY